VDRPDSIADPRLFISIIVAIPLGVAIVAILLLKNCRIRKSLPSTNALGEFRCQAAA
jgi:hypothetical protein